MDDEGQTLGIPAAVKSAQRVLEVLELFAARQEPATVTQVKEALGYPQSSTSALLSSLVVLGYLTRDGTGRYFPTLRVMLLGTWLQDSLFNESSLSVVMEGLQHRTGAAVLVGLRQGVHVRFILSMYSRSANALRYPVGVVRPVCLSAAGKALLAAERDAEVARIARFANAEAGEPSLRVDVPAFVAEIRATRSRGWAESVDYPTPGRVTLAIQVPPMPGQPAMAIALGFRSAELETRRASLLEALHTARAALQRQAIGDPS